MHPLLLTVSTPAHALARLSAAEVAATQLQGRCSERVCYAQTTTPAGERAYGHFSMEAEALADTVGRQLLPSDPSDEPSLDLTLHRWLLNHDHPGEPDEPATALSSAWTGLEHLVEEVFTADHARVFCTCCNRNVARPAVRLERSARHADAVSFRYFCPEGHLLLGLRTGHLIAAAESRAA